MNLSDFPNEALSPCPTEHYAQDLTTQYSASNAQSRVQAEYFDDVGPTNNLYPLQQFLDSHDEPYAQANTSNQPSVVRMGADTRGNRSQAHRAFPKGQQNPPQYGDDVLCGMANYAESPGTIHSSCETKSVKRPVLGTAATSPSNTNGRFYSVTSPRSTITPMPYAPKVPGELSEVRSTLYSTYRGLFLDSDGARDHRHLSTRFDRQPYIHPDDDPSIEQVESDRSHQVGRIYDAMVSGDRAQDNPGSIAMKRWVACAHYKSDLVEAFAHKVFDCLLLQVKEGFRGWHHNDYVDDDRKGEKEDREVDCMGRLENIIDALEREKTICEDVVNSASQIRMFVNAPIAYAARKLQNRLGNSKRGRTKDVADSNPRPNKARRNAGRQVRARSTTLSDAPTSRDTTPQFHTLDTPAMPYYAAGCSQQYPSSPTPAYLAPRQPSQRSAPSMPQVPTGYRQATAIALPIMTRPTLSSSSSSRPAMSPPTAPVSRPYTAPATTMPPAQMAPITEPNRSALPPPDYPMTTTPPNTWPTMTTLDNSIFTPVDPLLSTDDLPFPQQLWTDDLAPVHATHGTDYFDQPTHVSLADIEHVPLQPVDDSTGGTDDFESLWNAQPGVQLFSFDGPVEQGMRWR